MCAAIAGCHASLQAATDALPIELQLAAWAHVARNTEPEQQACQIRLRAERCHAILLRDAAGLPPKNKRDAVWLAQFGEVQP
jgi:hypothetical protein